VPDLAIAEQDGLSLAMILVRRGATQSVIRTLRLPSPGRLVRAGAMTLLWHGPDRFLAARQGCMGSELAAELSGLLADAAYVVDASASRVVLSVSGPGAAEALRKLLPIDLHPRVFSPGSVALTCAAHIDVTVWRESDQPLFGLACASSYAESFRRRLASL
jgi:heterotetrameric sarcosine oxidase gamma subunit